MQSVKAVDGEREKHQVVRRENGEIDPAHRRPGISVISIAILCLALILTLALGRRGGFVDQVILWCILCALWVAANRLVTSPRTGLILVTGVTLRLLPFLFSPQLSGDAYRYLWDGMVSASGINPYRHAPADAALTLLRTEWFSLINHPEIPTLYPPAAQLAFLIVAWSGGGLFALRLLFLLADIGTLRILQRRAGERMAFAYATFPLVMIEGFWSAHIEILALYFLMAGWELLLRGKGPGWSGVLLGIAAGIKLTPAAALPAFFTFASARARLALAFAATLIIPAIPSILSGSFMSGLGPYATRWIFNSPLYALTRGVLDRLDVAEALKEAWSSFRSGPEAGSLAAFIEAHLYSDFLARAILGMAFVLLIALALRRSSTPAVAITRCIGVLILCSPTIHPWYWLILVPFALAIESPFWISLALASPLSYLLYVSPDLEAVVFGLCYGIPVAALLWQRFRRRRSEDRGRPAGS